MGPTIKTHAAVTSASSGISRLQRVRKKLDGVGWLSQLFAMYSPAKKKNVLTAIVPSGRWLRRSESRTELSPKRGDE